MLVEYVKLVDEDFSAIDGLVVQMVEKNRKWDKSRDTFNIQESRNMAECCATALWILIFWHVCSSRAPHDERHILI